MEIFLLGGALNESYLVANKTVESAKKSLLKSSSAVEVEDFPMKKVSFRAKDLSERNLKSPRSRGKDQISNSD